MGIAAYNRGSRAIRERIDQEQRDRNVVWVGPASIAPKPADDPLPEGRLRSTFFADDVCNGTALFLDYEKRWYVISTHFQILKRVRKLDKAIRIFERLEMFGLCALERDK